MLDFLSMPSSTLRWVSYLSFCCIALNICGGLLLSSRLVSSFLVCLVVRAWSFSYSFFDVWGWCAFLCVGLAIYPSALNILGVFCFRPALLLPSWCVFGSSMAARVWNDAVATLSDPIFVLL